MDFAKVEDYVRDQGVGLGLLMIVVGLIAVALGVIAVWQLAALGGMITLIGILTIFASGVLRE